VIPAAVRREARPIARIAGAAAALALALTALVTVANLRLVGHYTVTSARITGGEPAADVIRAQVKGIDGRAAAWLSSLANAPARAAFAWRHDTSLAAYDRVIGVHVLGDTYPGLNSYADQKRATIRVGNANPIVAGVAPVPGLGATLAAAPAHVLVVVNRSGRLEVRVPIDGDGQATVSWNGREVLDQSIGPGAVLRFRTADLRRGANDLVIEARPGTTIHDVELEAITP
jgi:hypothetical protein